LVNAIIIS